jgi:hypothetical protein
MIKWFWDALSSYGSFWLYWILPRIIGLPKLSSLYNRAIALGQTAPPGFSLRWRIAMGASRTHSNRMGPVRCGRTALRSSSP